MEQLLCGPGEVFGLEPAADEWAISECSEDVAVGGIGLLFTLCFLRRRRRIAQPQRAVETTVDGSIYSALDGSDEATGLLEAEVEGRGQQATIQSLAARRDAEQAKDAHAAAQRAAEEADKRNEAPFTVQRYDRLPVAEGA